MDATISGFADVRPDRLYGVHDIAALFGVTKWTVQKWCRTGRLTPIPRSAGQRVRVLGASLLALLGESAPLTVQSETKAERSARARRAVDDIRRMAERN